VTNQGDGTTYGASGPITVTIPVPATGTLREVSLPAGWTVTSQSATEIVVTSYDPMPGFSSVDLVFAFTNTTSVTPDTTTFDATVDTNGEWDPCNNSFAQPLTLTKA